MNQTSTSDKELSVLTNYLQWVQDCYNKSKTPHRPLFFRGHADRDWFLQPAIFRKPQLKERIIILDYKQAFVKDCDYLSSMERILVKMQHHLIPTRLLDWSISPLNALYFACSNKNYMDKDAKVYVMDPWEIYKDIKRAKCVPTYYQEIMKQARFCVALEWSLEEIFDYIRSKFNYNITSRELEMPLPIVGRYMDERVKTQQGCFALWGTDKQSLDFFSAYKPNLRSFDIAAKEKPYILKILSQFGFNEFTLFTDLEGMSKTIQNNGSIFRL